MFDEDKIHLCYSCDAEFAIDAITDEDPPVYCPFCGTELEESEEEDDEE